MNLKEYADKEGFKPLNTKNHPDDGSIVEVLGSGIVDSIKIEKVKWSIENGKHSCKWITHDHNRGIMTMTPEYWR